MCGNKGQIDVRSAEVFCLSVNFRVNFFERSVKESTAETFSGKAAGLFKMLGSNELNSIPHFLIHIFTCGLASTVYN